MRNTLIKLSASLICLTALSQPALADYGSTSSAPPSTTVESVPPAPPSIVSNSYSISPAPPSTTVVRPRHHQHITSSVTVTANNYSSRGLYHQGRHHPQPFWIAMHNGEPVPTNAVVGGNQYNPNAMFYVCRANYRGGVHPGKLLSGNCNISWGGREIVISNYEVLISDTPLAWVESSHGAIPRHAVEGGRENHRKLFICQANYENGTHPGKIIGRNCNFGWGGREIVTPYFNVLTS